MNYLKSGSLALAIGLIACSPQLSDKDYAKEAMARFAADGGHPRARILSIMADGMLERACGWVDLGDPGGIALLTVRRRPGEPDSGIDLYTPGVGDPTQRIAETFYSQVFRHECMSEKLLPPAPAGFAVSAETAAELDHLWDDHGPEWAIIQPPGRPEFVGVRRRRGGGMIITPPFASRAETLSWIDREGNALAKSEQAKGAAAMARLDACLEGRRKDNIRCSSEGMDQVVQLHSANRSQ